VKAAIFLKVGLSIPRYFKGRFQSVRFFRMLVRFTHEQALVKNHLDASASVEYPQNQTITASNIDFNFGSTGAPGNFFERLQGDPSNMLSMMLSVRNAWSGLDSLEKVAVVFAVLALTMAAWALGSSLTP
jgi:hypothetical protein